MHTCHCLLHAPMSMTLLVTSAVERSGLYTLSVFMFRCNSENIPGHNIPAGKFGLGKLFLGIFWLAKIFRLRPGISFRKGKSWFALVKIFRAKLGNQNAISKSRIHLRGSIEFFSRVIRTPSAVMKPAAFERIALFLESSEQLYFLSERYRKTSS